MPSFSSGPEARVTHEAEGVSWPRNRVAFARFRQDLSDHVNDVQYTKKPLGIMRHRKLVAVVIPVEMYKILEKMTDITILKDL